MLSKGIDYYLSKGFEPKLAEYFASGRKTLTAAEALPDYRVMLTYDQTEKRIFDAKSLIQPGTVFAFLQDAEAFARVYVDDTHSLCWDKEPNVDSEVVWENKVDISPDSCYVESIRV